MPPERPPPDFELFSRWVASRFGPGEEGARPSEPLAAAARVARDEHAAGSSGKPRGRPVAALAGTCVEVLTLLAAATLDDTTKPRELVTERGFRVAMAYEDSEGTDPPSVCVLIKCPAGQAGRLEGSVVSLWIGSDRFELGQFDADGKAIGVLPAGVHATLSDFASGRVRLEAPQTSPGD